MTAAAADLATYLGETNIDEDRANLLLQQAETLCWSLLHPDDDPDGQVDLPAACDTVILSAAARAYVNPTGITAQMAGPYQVSRPTGGVYLTKAERASVMRLAGRTGAFSINLLGDYATRFSS